MKTFKFISDYWLGWASVALRIPFGVVYFLLIVEFSRINATELGLFSKVVAILGILFILSHFEGFYQVINNNLEERAYDAGSVVLGILYSLSVWVLSFIYFNSQVFMLLLSVVYAQNMLDLLSFSIRIKNSKKETRENKKETRELAFQKILVYKGCIELIMIVSLYFFLPWRIEIYTLVFLLAAVINLYIFKLKLYSILKLRLIPWTLVISVLKKRLIFNSSRLVLVNIIDSKTLGLLQPLISASKGITFFIPHILNIYFKNKIIEIKSLLQNYFVWPILLVLIFAHSGVSYFVLSLLKTEYNSINYLVLLSSMFGMINILTFLRLSAIKEGKLNFFDANFTLMLPLKLVIALLVPRSIEFIVISLIVIDSFCIYRFLKKS